MNSGKELGADPTSGPTSAFRVATSADAGAICSIYNPYIRDTVVTFEEEAVTEAAMQQRLAAIGSKFPWLVAELGGGIVGYAYATEWRSRSAYRHSVETTVYLASDCCGKGLGTALYRELIERLRPGGFHRAIGGIALPNEASVALHEKLGFRKVAHLTEVGRKFGRWIDVGYWELAL
ncbi:MAG TPA: arsinothricin resistance N-acetyltransferase ArsN1 family B [Opitutaceae bacterium]|nr:arsinothricin resistance N-acetyltransferase ArsN1 family B [Opitutaceae bacterium]